MIVRYAKQQNVDVALVKAVVAVESAFEPEAVSPKGAVGLMQVIPETAQRYGLNDDKRRTVAQKLLDPAINLDMGTRHLRALLALFTGDVALTLAAYNAGEGVVLRYDKQIPPYPETQEFVRLVQQFYAMYQPPPPPHVTKPTRITIPSRGPVPREGAAHGIATAALYPLRDDVRDNGATMDVSDSAAAPVSALCAGRLGLARGSEQRFDRASRAPPGAALTEGNAVRAVARCAENFPARLTRSAPRNATCCSKAISSRTTSSAANSSRRWRRGRAMACASASSTIGSVRPSGVRPGRICTLPAPKSIASIRRASTARSRGSPAIIASRS